MMRTIATYARVSVCVCVSVHWHNRELCKNG